MNLHKLLISIFISISFNVFAVLNSDNNFTLITQDNGLTTNCINEITQDSDGVIWLASDNGLLSYNGNKFNIYNHNKEDNNTLPHHRVLSINIDCNNTLWISTAKGVCIMSKNKSIQRIDGNHKFHLLSDISSSTIKKSTDNSIWLHSKKSIIRISPQQDSIIEYPIYLKNSYINTF